MDEGFHCTDCGTDDPNQCGCWPEPKPYDEPPASWEMG